MPDFLFRTRRMVVAETPFRFDQNNCLAIGRRVQKDITAGRWRFFSRRSDGIVTQAHSFSVAAVCG